MTAPIHVLHVDDEPGFAEMTAEFLEREDDRFTVETETSASEGLDRLASDDIDCIVSDYDMPGQNGIEFLETVREEYPDLPFILYTGKGSEEVASDAISAGITDYLQKGSGTEQYELLTNRIQNSVEQYDARQTIERERIHRSALFENTPDPIMKVIFDGKTPIIDDVNTAFEEVFGFEDESVIGRSVNDAIVPGSEREKHLSLRDDVFRGTPVETEVRRQTSDGVRDFILRIIPVDVTDISSGAYAWYTDITERKEHKQTPRDEREFINQALDTLNDVFYVVGTDGTLRRWNDRLSEVTGYTDEEIADMQAADFFPEDEQERITEAIDETLTTENVVVEAEFLTADDEYIPYEFTGSRLTDSEGDPIGLIGIGRDITERKEREQAIEDLHSTARAFMEAETAKEIADIIVEAVRDILDMPANGVHLYDESEGELVPVAWSDRIDEIVGKPPAFAPGEGIAGVAFETGEAQVYEDISTVPERYNPDTIVRSQIALPLDDHGVLLIGSEEIGAFDDTDVNLARTLATHATTALTRAGQEIDLRDKTARLEALYEHSPDMIDVLNPDGRLLDANQRFCAELGYTEEEVLGRPIWEIDRLVDAEDVRTLLSDFSTGERRKFEGEYERADGSTFPVEVHLLRLDLAGEDRFLAISRDITERKERERELERQNERLDQFASVISHDLRNPLNVAQGRLELAREEIDSENLSDAANAVDRGLALLDDLRTLASEGEQISEVEPVDLAETSKGCWQTVDTMEATLVVETEQTVRADHSRLQQLLENLYRNAIDHGGEDVTVTVGDLDDGFYVADNGPGIPPDERDEAFDAGYSTTEDGTGFGLNIVQQIATAHGWEITVTDSEANGARFEISGVEFADG